MRTLKRITWLLAVALVVSGVFICTYQPWAGENKGGSDRVLTKVTFIHFKKGQAKPPWAGGGGGKKEQEGYYSYIANGARWRTQEDVRLNPFCDERLDELAVVGAVYGGMTEWETPGDASLDIFGNLDLDDKVSYENGDYRGYNTISFGYYSDPDVIAVTSVWGYFTGPPSQREIIETHILMNDDFVWGDVDPNKPKTLDLMDVQNIATHELGHCAGMGDLYEAAAGEETMYGYSTEGEIKKRDLYKGDITGITKLY